jgi:hypothetical protein
MQPNPEIPSDVSVSINAEAAAEYISDMLDGLCLIADEAGLTQLEAVLSAARRLARPASAA